MSVGSEYVSVNSCKLSGKRTHPSDHNNELIKRGDGIYTRRKLHGNTFANYLQMSDEIESCVNNVACGHMTGTPPGSGKL